MSNVSLSSTSDVVNVSFFPNVAILTKSQKVILTLFWILHKTIRNKVNEIHRIMAGDGEPLPMLTEEGQHSESWLEATDRVMNDEVFLSECARFVQVHTTREGFPDKHLLTLRDKEESHLKKQKIPDPWKPNGSYLLEKKFKDKSPVSPTVNEEPRPVAITNIQTAADKC